MKKRYALVAFIIALGSFQAFSQNLLIKGGWVFDTSSKSFKKNSGFAIENALL